MDRKAIKTIGFMMAVTLVSKLLGLVREVFLASYYGAGLEAAAFSTAADIPLKFFDLAFGAAVTSTFIPVFNKYLKNDDDSGGFLFASRFINLIFILTTALAVLGMVFSNQLISLFLPGGSSQVRELAARLLVILFPTAILAGLTFSMISILQSMKQFTVPAMISLFPNLITIGYLIFLNKRFGITGLAVAFLLSWGLQALIQLPFISKKGFVYTPSVSLRDAGIRSVSKMALPILVSSWVQPVSLFMLGAFASFAGDESVAAIKYANRLYLILAGIFVFAMMNYLFPLMSRQADDAIAEDYKNTYRRAFENLCFFIIPLALAAFLLSPALISIVYERGAFNEAASGLTANAFAGFSLAIFGFSLYEITSKAYYATRNVIAPTIASLIALAVTFSLSAAAVFWLDLGIGYISLSFSIGITAAAITLVFMFNKKMNGLLKGRSIAELLKSLLSALFMGIAIYLIKIMAIDGAAREFWPKLALTMVAAVSGAAVYLISMALLKSPTFAYYYKWAELKLKGRTDG
ncbi:MAG: murein biosynthesis integral membrane protein MurJ [Clostridia bacterium]|nr:murein biosynthesis integral membrane protein MurJ [Clostridia bacterium]